jgi:hypothetical protein
MLTSVMLSRPSPDEVSTSSTPLSRKFALFPNSKPQKANGVGPAHSDEITCRI